MNEKETVIFNLTNPSDMKKLRVDEDFWSYVRYVTFASPYLEIRLKNFTTHRFLHYWVYKNVQDPSQAYTEKEKRKFWEKEKCKYCFMENNKEFLNWFYVQAKERDLIDFGN